MTRTEDTSGAPEASTTDKLKEQLSTARGKLGDTVEELAAKADVKHRAQVKAEELKHRVEEHTPPQVKDAAERAAHGTRDHPLPVGAALTALVLAVVYLLLRRRNHR